MMAQPCSISMISQSQLWSPPAHDPPRGLLEHAFVPVRADADLGDLLIPEVDRDVPRLRPIKNGARFSGMQTVRDSLLDRLLSQPTFEVGQLLEHDDSLFRMHLDHLQHDNVG